MEKDARYALLVREREEMFHVKHFVRKDFIGYYSVF
jgi:hypothetical protein